MSGKRIILLGATGMVGGCSLGYCLSDPDVSRRHAVINAQGDWFTIEDQGSTNGLFVNSERCTRSALEHGDFVEMGGTLLAFERVVP